MNSRRGPIIAAVASVLMALIVLVFLLLPRISAVGKKSDELDKAQAKQQTLEVQLQQLKEAQAQAGAVQRQLNRLETKIPPTPDLPSLIRLLQTAADSSAVDFMSVSPGTPTQTIPGISTITLSINVTGSFFSVEEYLFKMETLPRAVRVTTISVAPGGTIPGTLTLTMSGETYTTALSAGPGTVPGAAPPPGAVPVPTGTPTTSPTTPTTGG
ncbi:MAG: type 4a pilus biogenesis protein PilO [Actinomycetota bacterium]